MEAEKCEWIQAMGLVSTLNPKMEIDVDNPLDMAKKIVDFVETALAAAKERIEED